jgi:hypothetical protein
MLKIHKAVSDTQSQEKAITSANLAAELTYLFVANGPTRQTHLDLGNWGLDRCRCYRHFGAKSRSPGVAGFGKNR